MNENIIRSFFKTNHRTSLFFSAKNKLQRQYFCLAIFLFQALFLISPSFSSELASTQKERKADKTHMVTKSYVLGEGETVSSVAKKLGLTLAQLEQINQFRTFPQGFEQVSSGEKIDIPVPIIAEQGATKVSVVTPNEVNCPVGIENNPQTKEYVKRVSALLASSDPTTVATDVVRSEVSSTANKEIQKWLGQYGTAQVRLNVDDKFSLRESSLDWLFSFYDSSSAIIFTQLGIRNKDHRNTANLGLGGRISMGNWILGANTFYDNDLTGINSRLGFGAEAWTDYLQLSANSYMRLNNWHQSRDFIDHDERPANGFDIRTNAWLPVLPQLGGKLMYEQYSGDSVALFGKDKLQKNPYAVTAGITYTPFPLLTFGIDERRGKAGKSDTQFNIQLSYHLGESWLSLTDPSAVAGTRQLAEARYNLVDRNNNIVLEYQKQDILNITSTEQLRGYSGDNGIILTKIVSKHNVERVEWINISALLAAGGNSVELPGRKLAITYPPYQIDGNNTYHVDVVAYDSRGNRSNISTTAITVLQKENTPSTVNAVISELITVTNNAWANGVATNSVKATVTDEQGSRLIDQVVNFSADNDAIISATGTTDSNGEVLITLTNNTVGEAIVTASINNTELTTPTIFLPIDIITGINVNNYRFAANEGFPSTGFVGAYFQFEINTTTTLNSNYNWTSSQPDWVAVDNNGSVKFLAEPSNKSPVTITATSKSGNGVELSYTFTIDNWFIHNDSNYMTGSAADKWCASYPGYEVPSYRLITNAWENSSGTRGVGAFWPEWGKISYFNVNFPDDQHWAKEYSSNGEKRYTVGLTSGYLQPIDYPPGNNTIRHVTCIKQL
ncbi:inverse autotransporter beta domain-containing protein [Yersinia ruckeri]|nr:inverse autotransporter beta domain-containing protein [Yersinia ruckeri]EKN4201009.1 inverse autotransporter beta domain-containing protein [Yersinia ruckeri]EKN4725641.1 inverse autotransporter beta domain-containing protein [Yersinia ruckeri]ELV7519362.1 inverse autotransporter beta domain-containing protein [Yersinia ruckeri]